MERYGVHVLYEGVRYATTLMAVVLGGVVALTDGSDELALATAAGAAVKAVAGG